MEVFFKIDSINNVIGETYSALASNYAYIFQNVNQSVLLAGKTYSMNDEINRTFTLSSLITATSGDVDLEAYYTAAGTFSPRQKYAFNELVYDSKKNGWWYITDVILPFPTDHEYIENKGRYNLKDATLLGIYSGGAAGRSASYTGLYTKNAYFHTILTTPATTIGLTLSQFHMSIYNRVNDTGGSRAFMIGINSTVNSGPRIECQYDSITFSFGTFSNPIGYKHTIATSSETQGYLMVGSDGTIGRAFKNGVVLGTFSFENQFLPNANIGDNALGGGGVQIFTGETSFITIGRTMSENMGRIMYNDIQKYQTILGRQV